MRTRIVPMRFSVLIPVYNGEKYLAQTLDSVLAQTFTDFEVLVVDDGSDDRTLEILESYGSRIRTFRVPHGGPELARNRALAYTCGEYLAFLDADDLFYPHTLATYDALIREHNPPMMIGSRAVFSGNEPMPPCNAQPVTVFVRQDFLQKRIDMGTSMSMIVIRRSAFEEIGGTRNCSPESWHLNDFHLFLKAATLSPCVVVRSPATVAYRYHDANCHRNAEAMVNSILSLIVLEKRGEFPGGEARRKERYFWIGNVAWHWLRRLVASGQWKLAARLCLHGAPMLSLAISKKVRARIRPERTPERREALAD